ncbi:polymer-forming cytoskeletal protein [Inquilinus sp.]|jgi:cytoskeletal protein CcmA (bactofilin family)|uniref:polymer-forming cytoskeletal protein n=1 Tax=Inquilinus sp. TaxID=1932117 RepID=UPI00378410A4
MSSTAKPATGYKTDLPRRIDLPGTGPGAAGAVRRPDSAAAPGGRESPRKLIVGSEISLAGEITACDHLVVEGRIEAKIKDCQTIEIAAQGVFKGSAEISDGDIAGRFEGDLSVSGLLRLRASGVVTGTVKYGELQVETGGKLIGTLQPLGGDVGAVAPAAAASAAQPAPTPLFDDKAEAGGEV